MCTPLLRFFSGSNISALRHLLYLCIQAPERVANCGSLGGSVVSIPPLFIEVMM